MPSNEHLGTSDKGTLDLDVLIVGAGFGGMYALHNVRQLGLQTKLFEAGTDLGGVWYWNRYPGARVDSEIPYYQFSVPEVWKTWNWSCRFPDHIELKKYFNHVDKVLHLKKDILFNANVISSRFDASTTRWTVETGSGLKATCKYLIMATGSSYKRHYPDFKGLHDFKGILLHSAIWPAEDVDCKDKRVAIVGSGATGVQLVEQLSKRSKELTVFMRSPNIALPMRQRPMTPEEQNSWKSIYPTLFKASRNSSSGLPYHQPGGTTFEIPDEQLEATYEDLFARGGFNFNIGGYRDFLFDIKANRRMYDFWAKKTRARITDPVKRDIVAPLEPPFAFGTKRSSLEQDYYECVDRPNVSLVNLKETPIKEFQKNGIVTEDGKLREFDVICLATGYDSVTGSLTGMGLQDKNGVDMRQRWKDGVFTYLGMTCSGFPNMFIVYGPQAPTAFANGTTIVEMQVDWISDAIKKLVYEGVKTIEAKKPAEEAWKRNIMEMNEKTLFPLTNSWYMGDNIPGKKREQLNYLAGIQTYEKVCRAALDSWDGFEIVPEKQVNGETVALL